MKISISLLCLIIIVLSCKTDSSLISAHYKMNNTSLKYSMDIPKNYKYVGKETSSARENRYEYADSSFIYITNYITPNYENIKAMGDSILSVRFQNKNLLQEINAQLPHDKKTHIHDTLVLYGQSETRRYWKDKKLSNITIGYGNVPEAKKDVYDNALKTFRVRER